MKKKTKNVMIPHVYPLYTLFIIMYMTAAIYFYREFCLFDEKLGEGHMKSYVCE